MIMMVQYGKRIYGRLYQEHPENLTRCVTGIICPDRIGTVRQCRFKRGYGPGQRYCKRHDPTNVKRLAKEEKHKRKQEQIQAEMKKVIERLCLPQPNE